MPNAVSALQGASYSGFVEVTEVGPIGMITLRAALTQPKLAKAVQAAIGIAVPDLRRIETRGDSAVAWMAPDELLLILPYAGVQGALAALEAALAGQHFLAVDVSDARAVFRVRGAGARDVLAKLCPVDLSPAAFQPGEIRRTRAAQVPAAIWRSAADEFSLVSFRSVAGYVFALLQASATPGGEVGLF